MDAIPPIEVPFSEPILEGILHTLVSNAVAHGTEPQVTCTVLADGGAQVVVRNAGQLPFEDVAELQPLEHRARGGLGLGLYVAHHLAVAQGLSLSVRDTGDGHVEAVFTIPSSPPAPDPTMAPESAPVE